MTRHTEADTEARAAKMALRAFVVCTGGLEEAVSYAGGELTGFSAKCGGVDWLLTLRAEFPAGPQVTFVGGDTLASALLKAAGEAKSDRLRWRDDRYAKSEGGRKGN